MNCKFCGAPIEEKPGGHRIRGYCHNAHRQAYWRQQHQQDQDAAMFAEVEALRAKVNVVVSAKSGQILGRRVINRREE